MVTISGKEYASCEEIEKKACVSGLKLLREFLRDKEMNAQEIEHIEQCLHIIAGKNYER